MAGRVIKRLLAGVLTVAVVIPGNFVPAQAAEEPQEDYLIYPNPHKVEYQEGDYILGKELNVISFLILHLMWIIRKEITFSEKN